MRARCRQLGAGHGSVWEKSGDSSGAQTWGSPGAESRQCLQIACHLPEVPMVASFHSHLWWKGILLDPGVDRTECLPYMVHGTCRYLESEIKIISGKLLFLWHCPPWIILGVLDQIPQDLQHPKLGLDHPIIGRPRRKVYMEKNSWGTKAQVKLCFLWLWQGPLEPTLVSNKAGINSPRWA